jgi:oligopeptide transport system substrate-binding protein
MDTWRLMGLCLFTVGLVAMELPDWKQPFWPEDDGWRQVDQHLRFNNESEPATLDPHQSKTVNGGRLMMALYEGLVSNDPTDLSIRPGVARAWSVSADGLAYRFQLRADARWSDGASLTAADFVASWRRALDPALAASYAYMLFPIKGAEAYFTGQNTDPASIGVQAVTPQELLVRLEQPCPYFLDLCAFETLMPVRVDLIRQYGSSWTQPGKLVSNGPFVLDEWKPRQNIVLKKNSHYWDADFVKLETITAFPYENIEAAYQLFRTGDLHWINGVPKQRARELEMDPDYYAAPYLGSYFYRINCARPPFDDARVRRALSQSINRKAITTVLGAGEQPSTALLPPGVGGYHPVAGLPEDPARARELLAEAGFPDGEGFPSFELWYNNSDDHKKVAETIIEQWRQQLNITAKLRNCEWRLFVQRQDQLQYDVSRSGWIGDYNDPNTFLDLWVSGGGNNRTGWSHAEYDRLLAASQATIDQAERRRLFRDMERILVEREMPIIPLYIYVYTGMQVEHLRGIRLNVRDRHPFQYLWLE